MANIEIPLHVSLDYTVGKTKLRGALYALEDQAHRFVITAMRDYTDITLDGQVTGSFIRADGATVPLVGSIVNGKAEIVLEAACYAIPGPFTFTIFNVSSSNVRIVLFSCDGTVIKTGTWTVVDPGNVVADVNDIVAEYAAMQQAEAAAIAAAAAGNGALRAIGPYNGFDILATLTKTNASFSDGVTFTWNTDGTCRVSGTATALHVNNLWSNQNTLPDGLEAGKTYKTYFTSTSSPASVWMGVQFYANGAWTSAIYPGASGTSITVPEGTTGARIRLGISAGSTADETVTMAMIAGTTHDELSAATATVDSRIDTEAYLAHGVLDSCDLNTVTAPGYYLLSTGDYSYTNVPTDWPGAGGQLEVLNTATNTKLQRITFYGTNHVYIRQSRSGEFSQPWKLVNAGREMYGKYVAFGDSLTYGAVWRPESQKSQSLYRAAEEYRMPMRIARALGAENDYANAALGGAGYVYRTPDDNGNNIVDLVKAYDFSDTEIVTIMGGANDKLKTSDATHDYSLNGICSAIQEIISWFKDNPSTVKGVREHMQTIQLIFIQPLPSGFSSEYDPWTKRGAAGWSLNDFDARVSELCRANHVGYVNWEGCTYCDTWAERNVGYSSNNGPNYTHPIVETDYALLGDFIGGKVATYGYNGASIPVPPSTNGTYRLTCTVSNGTVSYSWVSA